MALVGQTRSQIVQAVLIREGLVVFYGNEVSLGAFYGSWLFWLATGSMLVIALRGRRWVREPLPALRALLAQPDAWEIVTFEEANQAPISYALESTSLA